MQKKRSSKKIWIAVALLAALACAAELCCVALQNRLSADGLALQSVGADSFESWEFEARGGGDYYALANNSYFYAEELGGQPVRKFEVLLTRDSGDASACILFCTGVVDGIRGDFLVPLSRQADGSYVGYKDCSSLEAIKLYPTENVRTTIHFEGVILNPDVQTVRFSGARCLLWASVFAALGCLFLLFRFYALHRGERPSLWLCVYAAAAALLLTAVFAATRTYTSTYGTESVLLPAALAAFTLLYGGVWFIVARLRTAHARAAAAALVAGLLFCFANAPLQAPDEHSHFLRAFALSQGSFNYVYEYDYPADVDRLIDAFPGKFYDDVQQTGKGSVAAAIRGYLADPGAAGSETCRTSVQLLLPYVFSALGIALARLLGANALLCLYAGRAMNALVFAVCVYFSVRMTARRRGALLLTALLPLTLYMAASVSYDSMFLSACVLYLGFMLKDAFSRRDLLLSAFAFGVMIMIKPIYLPLALLYFGIPKDQLRVRLPRAGVLLALLAAGGVFYGLAMGYADLFNVGIPPSGVPDGVDIAAQVRYVLKNPIRYALVLLVDGWQNSFYLTGFGTFGWLDVTAPLTTLLSPALLVAVAALYADEPSAVRREPLLHAVTLLLGYGVIVTGFYATWSTLGSTSILGVQSRYFIPFLPLLAALLSRAFGGALRYERGAARRDAVCTALCGGAAVLSAAELFTMYFLM
ncbi:MAG: DUF2142 domain-containing protein [Oscillospiraceae bacterium]|nr:DUF2142 domain-containing protein [Oscillospiraceae bacterium]